MKKAIELGRDDPSRHYPSRGMNLLNHLYGVDTIFLDIPQQMESIQKNILKPLGIRSGKITYSGDVIALYHFLGKYEYERLRGQTVFDYLQSGRPHKQHISSADQPLATV